MTDRSAVPSRSRRLRPHLTYANVMSTLALLVAVAGGGAAYAAATVGSRDVINNSLKSIDIRNDTSKGGGLLSEDIEPDTINETDLGPGSVRSSQLSDLAFFEADIARAQSGLFAIPNDAIQSAEVEDGSLGTVDIDESTLTPLDGHDSSVGECDPGSSTYIVCDELSFTLGRPMPVFAAWTYGFGTKGGDPPIGGCFTTLNGANKSGDFSLQSEDDSDYNIGGKPVLDVMTLPAGTHKIGFRCQESAPDSSDLVIRNLYMSVVELGAD